MVAQVDSRGFSCESCGSKEFVCDAAKGDSVCTTCGAVQSQHSANFLVANIDFQEGNNGSKQAIGQHVGADGFFGSRTMLGHGHYLSGKDSKQATFMNAKNTIKDIAIPLKLPSHIIDMAFNFYKMCYNRNMTRGRKLKTLCAACLYLACRLELTSHMLIDFSQSIQTDMASILKYFLMIAKVLGIQIPLIDPCVYLPRFADKLELGNKTNEVVQVAINLISGMQRDWMATGRRPSGLCAAALLISSRLYGFHRTIDDVMKIFRLHKSTLLKRLTEFSKVPTGAMKYNEFLNSNDDNLSKFELSQISSSSDTISFKRSITIEPKRYFKLRNDMIQLQLEIDKLVEKNICPKLKLPKSTSEVDESKNITLIKRYDDNIDLTNEEIKSDFDDSEIENCLLSETEILQRNEILADVLIDDKYVHESKPEVINSFNEINDDDNLQHFGFNGHELDQSSLKNIKSEFTDAFDHDNDELSNIDEKHFFNHLTSNNHTIDDDEFHEYSIPNTNFVSYDKKFLNSYLYSG